MVIFLKLLFSFYVFHFWCRSSPYSLSISLYSHLIPNSMSIISYTTWWCWHYSRIFWPESNTTNEVILIGQKTNQGLYGLTRDQNGRKWTFVESINVQVHLFSNCLFILMAQLLPNIDFLFSNSRWNQIPKNQNLDKYQAECPTVPPPLIRSITRCIKSHFRIVM